MPVVPAGDETGEYYIIICGLPWNTSWQKLKDFARDQQPDGTYIEIDHAMIYPQNQTNGWVRVKGKENFLRALEHLNGGRLDHKALIADGRNETQPAMLLDLGVITSPSQRRESTSTDIPLSPGYQQYGAQLMPPFSPQESYSEWNNQPQVNYPPASPAFTTRSFYQPPSPIYEAAPTTFTMRQPAAYFTAAPQPSIVYAGNMPPTIPIYVPQRQPVYPCYPATYNTGLMSPPSTVQNMPREDMDAVTGPMVQTEARKVIIKGLPRDTREDALIIHINQLASKASSSRSHRPFSSVIHHIDFARHSDGRLKGHAFVIFENHRVAKKIIDAIDGQKFQNRPLRATLAKEGVEPFEAFHQHQQQRGYLTPESSGRTSQSPSMAHDKVDEREAAPKEYRHAQGGDNGERSSKSAKGKEKGSGDDRARKNRAKSREPIRGTPAVVDGSGRKRH